MERNWKRTLNLIIDICIISMFLWIFIVLQLNLFHCDDGEWSKGFKFFKYFTNIGGFLLAINSFISIIYYILNKKKDRFLSILKTITTQLMIIVFIVVYTVLAPAAGFFLCFKLPDYIFEHTLLPLLAIFQYFFIEERVLINKKDALYGIIPISIYTLVWFIVLLILNLPPSVELDPSVVPYFFLAIHAQPIYLSIIYFLGALLLTYSLTLGLILINNKFLKKN